jgi:hypothetical protein
LNVLLGYTLRFVLTATLAMVAAAILPGAANAAVVVLAFTIGTWALDFIAAGRGGLIERAASFTPTATLRTFEQGLFRVDVTLVVLLFAALFFFLTRIWLELGSSLSRRLLQSISVACVAAVLLFVAGSLHHSSDLSENRRNSFSAAEERALQSIDAPVTITVRLASEDPRMNDFRNGVLLKLRRSLRNVTVLYPFEGRSALFENDARYGELTYQIGTRSEINRSTTEEIVLETIGRLAGVAVPPRREGSYAGHPLAHEPRWAKFVFYLLWPLAVIAAWLAHERLRLQPRGR